MSTKFEDPQKQSGSFEERYDRFVTESLPGYRENAAIAFTQVLRLSHQEISRRLAGESEEVRSAFMKLMEGADEFSKTFASSIIEQDVVDVPEKERSPYPHEPQVIRPENILVLAKRSLVDLDRHRHFQTTGEHISDQDLTERYKRNGVNWEAVFESAAEQKASEAALTAIVGRSNFHYLWDLKERDAVQPLLRDKSWDAVILFGGDDTLKAGNPYLTGQFVIPVNSDSIRSVGANTLYSRSHFDGVFEALSKGAFVIQPWTRIASELTRTSADGTRETISLPPAMNEIAIGDQSGFMTARGEVELSNSNLSENSTARLKATGALIAVGSGSTGWYTSATEAYYPFGRKWPATMPLAEMIIREPYRFELLTNPEAVTEMLRTPFSPFRTVPRRIEPGTELTIRSTSKNNPVVAIDCVFYEPFPDGSTLSVKLSDNPLNIVVAKE